MPAYFVLFLVLLLLLTPWHCFLPQTPNRTPSLHLHHLLNLHLAPLTTPPTHTSPNHFIPLTVPAHAGLFLARLPPPSHRGPRRCPRLHGALSPSRTHTHPSPPRQHRAICRVSACWCAEPSHLAVTRLLLQPFTYPPHAHLQLATQQQCVPLCVDICVEVEGFCCSCVGVKVCLCMWRRYCSRRVQTQGANVISAHLLNWCNWEHDRQHSGWNAICQTSCF